jgi:hypothetical protein
VSRSGTNLEERGPYLTKVLYGMPEESNEKGKLQELVFRLRFELESFRTQVQCLTATQSARFLVREMRTSLCLSVRPPPRGHTLTITELCATRSVCELHIANFRKWLKDATTAYRQPMKCVLTRCADSSGRGKGLCLGRSTLSKEHAFCVGVQTAS